MGSVSTVRVECGECADCESEWNVERLCTVCEWNMESVNEMWGVCLLSVNGM